MKEKIYLEPQSEFNKCILSENEHSITYCYYELIDVLIEQFDNTVFSDEDELLSTAIEWFNYNVEPLKNYYNINFNYKMESYYLIKYSDPNNVKRYHKSTVYPGKMMYFSRKAAQNALQKVKDFYPKNVTFEIERVKND